MICSNCGTENRADRKFCLRCVSALAASCPNCGAANEPEAGFCGQCGQSLAAVATAAGAPVAAVSPPQAAAPVAERRLVSILFADLVGFTTLAEGRDPEDTRELLSRYFELARDVIARYGGTVEKFIGDAVMAVWGAPVAREDDAERAVRAALELVAAVRGLSGGLEARSGVLTGEAAVNLGAQGQGMVAGDLVNTASRLQSVAPSGAVLVDEATERAASKAIVFEAAGEQILKGKTSPVPAWRAQRVVAEVGGRNRAETLEAPFVGRDDELRLLKDLFHATARERRPRLVSVVGSAGIGKSRLAWEFLKYVDGLVETVYWHDGRSPSYGEGISFWALGEMVRGRCGLLETDDDATTRAKVAETVARWAGDEEERRWLEGSLLALLGSGDGLTSGSAELFAAWRTFFERIAAEGTVVMVFEDLHWADSGLLDFIDHLLDWSRGLPIFLLTLARPELLERRPEWGAGRRNFVALSLEPLAPAAMHLLLEGLVPGLPHQLGNAIVARADGIPLYAVETVRMLLADGRLVEEAGAYRPVGDLTDLAVPETLHALIAARLDGLEPVDRTLLQDAAVLGQSFSVAGLAAVAGGEPATLEPRLQALVRRELLQHEQDPRSPERGQYAFVQALIREVAYGTLAKADRKARHLAAARWFEALGEDELAGALAGHYVAALRNSSPGADSDALAVQARLTLKGAADRAAALGAHAQALAFLRQALEITSDPAERVALEERAAAAAHLGADLETARGYLEEALAWHREEGDRASVARLSAAMGRLLIDNNQPAAAIPIMEQALGEGVAPTTAPEEVGLLAELSRAYAITFDPRALATADRALAAAETLELAPAIAEALINRALALTFAGRLQEPSAILRGVLPFAERHGLVRSQLRAMNNLSAGLSNEDLRAAVQIYRDGVELARRLGDRGWLHQFQDALTFMLTFVGEWDEAARLRAEVEAEELSPARRLSFSGSAVFMDGLRGEFERARAILAEVEPLYAGFDDPRAAGNRAIIQAFLEALEGRLEEAFMTGREGAGMGGDSVLVNAEWATRASLWARDPARARLALDLYEAQPDRGRIIAADRWTLQAGMMALEGNVEGALGSYREATRVYRDLDLPLHLGLCLMDLGTLLDPALPEVSAAAAEARVIFERLGSPPLLARLDAGLEARKDAQQRAPAKAPSSVG
ncbi:MAG: AAA family ATPase [Candidatus Limnocylindrales bacterium]